MLGQKWVNWLCTFWLTFARDISVKPIVKNQSINKNFGKFQSTNFWPRYKLLTNLYMLVTEWLIQWLFCQSVLWAVTSQWNWSSVIHSLTGTAIVCSGIPLLLYMTSTQSGNQLDSMGNSDGESNLNEAIPIPFIVFPILCNYPSKCLRLDEIIFGTN